MILTGQRDVSNALGPLRGYVFRCNVKAPAVVPENLPEVSGESGKQSINRLYQVYNRNKPFGRRMIHPYILSFRRDLQTPSSAGVRAEPVIFPSYFRRGINCFKF